MLRATEAKTLTIIANNKNTTLEHVCACIEKRAKEGLGYVLFKNNLPHFPINKTVGELLVVLGYQVINGKDGCEVRW